MMIPAPHDPEQEHPDVQQAEQPSFPAAEELRAHVLVVQSRDLVTLTSDVAMRQHELTLAHGQLLEREARLQEQSKELMTVNANLEEANHTLSFAADRVRQLASIVESSGEAIFSKSLEGVITGWNRSAERLFGYMAEEIIGQSVSLLIPPDDQPVLVDVLARTRLGQQPIEDYETTRIMKDGTPVAVSVTISPLPDHQGRIIGSSTIAHDISEQQRIAEELARRSGELERAHLAASQLAAIVESSNDAIIGKTLEGVITSWNGSAEHLYGYAAGEVLGKSISLIIPADRQEELPKILERIKLGEATQHYETVRVRKDGTLIEVSVTVSPIRDVEGRIVGASTIAHDITERKRAEDALRQSRDELVASNAALEEANLARSQFLATMSHELRTPLTSIIGFSEMLLDDAREAGWDLQQQNSLERILANSGHLLGLINDVLDLSKMEAGRMVLDARQVDPRVLLSEVAAEIGSLAIKRNLFLKTEVEEGLGSLETNPAKLHQILLNLLSNALKFTELGGVMLSARRVLLSDEKTEGIAFAVQDSGIGIPPELQERVFEAFYQADMSYMPKVGGTGLGLSIVSQLTALLGGTITVASVPGQGSTFTLTLPVKATQGVIGQDLPRLHPGQPENAFTVPSEATEFAPARSPDLLDGSGQRNVAEGPHKLILAVDDNPDTLVLIKAALRDTSYIVTGVQDPLQVMELVQDLQPCAITLDVMMPDLNGWQLLHQMPEFRDAPIIAVTAHVSAADRERALAVGCTAHVVLKAHLWLICPFLNACYVLHK